MTSAVALASSAWLFNFLQQFSDPSGANGYFYLKQTESLAAGLGYYFKDRSLAFLLPALLMKICGDALLSFQVSIAIVWAYLVAGVGWLVWNLGEKLPSRWRFGVLLLSLLAVISTSQLYELSLTFFKNVFAVTLAVYALGFWTSTLNSRSRWTMTVVLSVLALLSHKSMLLLALCFAVPAVVLRASWRVRLWSLVALTGLALFFLWHFENGTAYLLAISGSFIGPSAWWAWFKDLRTHNTEMFTTIFAVLAIALLALVIRRRVELRHRSFVDGTLIFTLAALQPFQMPGANGPAYRMILLTPLFAIPLLVLSIGSTARIKYAAPSLLLLMLFFAQPWMRTKNLDDVFTPWDILREQVLQIREFVTPEDHLTSHHGMEFFIDEATGIRSRSFLSDHPEKKNFRVAYIARRWLPDLTAQTMLRERALLEIGSEYILLREQDWQELRRLFRLPRHWKNPEAHRPDYIYE